MFFEVMNYKCIASDEIREDPEDIYRVEEGDPNAAGYTNYTCTNQQEVENNHSLEPLMTCDNIDSLFSEFPPSFTDLLSNCSSNNKFGTIT
jgi:hypothetical protein